MASSTSLNLRKGSRKRALVNLADSASSESITQSCSQYLSTGESLQASRYIKGLSNRQRVDRILYSLHEEHRWTIKDLLSYMVTEEAEEKYHATPTKRAKDISTAVFDQPEVLAALRGIGSQASQYRVLEITDIIKKELWQFYDDPILGQFDIDTPPKDMDIPGLAKRIEETAPVLWEFIKAFTQSPHHRGNQERPITKAISGAFVMISTTLAHLYTPQRCNSFQYTLGIYLHSMGVKRATIDVLAGLGIIPDYTTILRNMTELAGKGMARYL
jgi:hypothetical protein